MIDTIKQFLASLHDLPNWLRQAFGVMFLGTMIVAAFTFKRWLENRRTTKDVDLWACVPVTPAMTAACLWALWASAAVYNVYLDADVKTAQAKEAGKAAAAVAAAPLGASAKGLRTAIAPKAPAHVALPEPDAARAPRPEVGGTVITGRSARPVHAGHVEPGAEAPAGAETAPAGSHIGTAADSTAPVAPVAATPEQEPVAEVGHAQPHGKLAKRLKKGRGSAHNAAATPDSHEPHGAHAAPMQEAHAQVTPDAPPAHQEAAPAAQPVATQQAAAPAAPPAPAAPAAVPAAAPADTGPRFRVEHPAEAPAAPAAH